MQTRPFHSRASQSHSVASKTTIVHRSRMVPHAVIGCTPETPDHQLHAFTLALARTPQQEKFVYLEEVGNPKVKRARPHPTSGNVRSLAIIYDALAVTDPRVSLTPLLPVAGWDAEKVATSLPKPLTLALPSHGSTAAAAAAAAEAPLSAAAHKLEQALTADSNSLTITHLDLTQEGLQADAVVQDILEPLVLTPPGAASQQEAQQSLGMDEQQQEQELQGPPQPHSLTRLCFKRIALGGTFDRLHCGHRLLLAAAALVAQDTAYVGITAEQLLKNKSYAEMLESYEARRDAAVGFMQAVRPGLNVVAGALVDPKEPTQAELDPTMEAIIVSKETLSGAEAINKGRANRGFQPLVIVVVPVIGVREAAGKLSSTELRAQDAAAAKKDISG